MTRYVKALRVVFSDDSSDAPADRVREISGQSDDINKGFGGSYVWLVPVYTDNPHEAASYFEIMIVPNHIEGYDDLGNDTGGQFRYQKAVCDPAARAKITEVGLYRSDRYWSVGPQGWNGRSSDINDGRQKTVLHIVWRTVEERR